MALHILYVIPILCLNLLKIPWRITANVTHAFYVVRLVAVMRNSKVKSFIKVHNTVKYLAITKDVLELPMKSIITKA